MTVLSIGTMWLTPATRPSVPSTALRPSSSGMPAATSAPKVTRRMSSVAGRESDSALEESLASWSASALFTLAPPNCPTKTSGLASLTLSTAVIVGLTSSSVLASSPLRSNSTSTERPSLETWPSLPFS